MGNYYPIRKGPKVFASIFMFYFLYLAKQLRAIETTVSWVSWLFINSCVSPEGKLFACIFSVPILLHNFMKLFLYRANHLKYVDLEFCQNLVLNSTPLPLLLGQNCWAQQNVLPRGAVILLAESRKSIKKVPENRKKGRKFGRKPENAI